MNQKAVRKHICERLAHGEPIQRILDPQPKILRYEDGQPVYDPDFVKPDLPDWNMVVEWLRQDEQFRLEWEHAKKMQAAFLSDQLLVLKEQVLSDPKNASAYKVAYEMVKTSAMWGDSKYSDRTIQDIKNSVPQNSEEVQARILQLEEELGLAGNRTVNVQAVEVKKQPSPAQLAHRAKLGQLARERNLAMKGKSRGKPNTKPE
jgi:hypothetical protein